MKTLMNKVNFAIVGLMSSMSVAIAADATGDTKEKLCDLVEHLGTLLTTLRTLAFIGAGFLIAQWAWDFIKKPEDVSVEKLKPKGVGLVVGFLLLFGIGFIISFLMETAGGTDCSTEFGKWSALPGSNN
jgi:Na+-driven multidrug efflux pump